MTIIETVKPVDRAMTVNLSPNRKVVKKRFCSRNIILMKEKSQKCDSNYKKCSKISSKEKSLSPR